MPLLDLAVSLGSAIAAGGSVALVAQALRATGPDLRDDPERVEHLIRTAPYDRLDNVVSR